MLIVYFNLLALVFPYAIGLSPINNGLRRLSEGIYKTITPPFDNCLAFTITAEISTIASHSVAATRYEMDIAEIVCLLSSSACIVL
jgi:hypothetical protein